MMLKVMYKNTNLLIYWEKANKEMFIMLYNHKNLVNLL